MADMKNRRREAGGRGGAGGRTFEVVYLRRRRRPAEGELRDLRGRIGDVPPKHKDTTHHAGK